MNTAVPFRSVVNVDGALRDWVVLHRWVPLDGLMLVLSGFGWSGLGWVVLATILAVRRRMTWRDVLRLGAALGIAIVASDHVLKPLIGRPRPFVVSTAAEVIGPRPHSGSLPSGHATAAFAGAGVLARCVPSYSWVWWTLAVLIAYSRIYLGVHYPLDVIVGAILGLVCAGLALIGRQRSH